MLRYTQKQTQNEQKNNIRVKLAKFKLQYKLLMLFCCLQHASLANAFASKPATVVTPS